MFEGTVDNATMDIWSYFSNAAFSLAKDELNLDFIEGQQKAKSAVDSRDVMLNYLYNKVRRDPTPENHEALMKEVQRRMQIDELFKQLNPTFKLGSHPPVTDFDCYRELIGAFEDACFPFEDYSMKYMGHLVNECESRVYFPGAKEQYITRLNEACSAVTFIQ